MHYAKKFTNTHDTAFDLVADVFVDVWRNKEHIIDGHDIEHYLMRSIRNKCISYKRKQKETVNIDFEIEQQINEDANITMFEALLAIEANRLTKQRKKVIELLLHGLALKQIANVLNIDYKTASATKLQAVNQLRNIFKQKNYQQLIFE